MITVICSWPDVQVHHSNSTDSTMFSNEPAYQCQVLAIPPSRPSFNIHPHLAVGHRFSSHPHYGGHPPTQHPYLHPPHPSPLLLCKWLHEDTLQICGFQGTYEALKAHCKRHFKSGPSHAQIQCRWDRCEYKKCSNSTVRCMRRDCLWRHISEIHLGMKRVT
ncbi:hypothetical protein BD769DRAFT_169647 [Suillus cothurnatus]|jgi:hypothetical protein|nr:hypothetical protein BD769DRAFT_169647 [Suillus cothurnatus]